MFPGRAEVQGGRGLCSGDRGREVGRPEGGDAEDGRRQARGVPGQQEELHEVSEVTEPRRLPIGGSVVMHGKRMS